MRAAYQEIDGAIIVYDADYFDQPSSEMFDPMYWEARAALIGQAHGRGTTWFVRQGGDEWALRHYLRGGVMVKLIRDSYLWCGLSRTRPWQEWHLTADLYRRGLPVPAPVAARVIRQGLTYRADIITRRIPAVTSLEQRLMTEELDREEWRLLGTVLRRFHDAGLCHADLNVRNILISVQADFYLIDFDRARLRPEGRWRQANLDRLLRSMRKLQSAGVHLFFSDPDWRSLLEAYQAGPA